MANVRTRGTDKVKVVSAVITLAVIVALVFGIFSVAQNVKKSKNNNLVNLKQKEMWLSRQMMTRIFQWKNLQ